MENEKTIAEINEVIAKVEAEIKPDCEIGARDKATLKSLLKNAGIEKAAKFVACKREHSSKVLAHFVKTKGIPQSKFSMNAQPYIFIIA